MNLNDFALLLASASSSFLVTPLRSWHWISPLGSWLCYVVQNDEENHLIKEAALIKTLASVFYIFNASMFSSSSSESGENLENYRK